MIVFSLLQLFYTFMVELRVSIFRIQLLIRTE